MNQIKISKGFLCAEVVQDFPVPLAFKCSKPSYIPLEYSVEYSRFSKFLGQEYFIVLKTKLWNHNTEIALVELPKHSLFKGKHPFILLSWRDGTNPTIKDSVNLIKSWQKREPVFCQDISQFDKIKTRITFYGN